jgi:hypothetical protein
LSLSDTGLADLQASTQAELAPHRPQSVTGTGAMLAGATRAAITARIVAALSPLPDEAHGQRPRDC